MVRELHRRRTQGDSCAKQKPLGLSAAQSMILNSIGHCGEETMEMVIKILRSGGWMTSTAINRPARMALRRERSELLYIVNTRPTRSR
ncbi:hypothetical protein J6590_054477 [Homalodisca vitripennis]|nr:hypothetical protein J6590_054477 [Homalodisca vitripennis]